MSHDRPRLAANRRPSGRGARALRIALACGLLFPLVGHVTARALRAQEATRRALNKGDLVRLVVTDAYSTREKIGIVRSVCLSFTPTTGDWDDVRALGADEELVQAIEACLEGGAPVRISLNRTRTVARAGQTVVVDAIARRGEDFESGLDLQAVGSGGPGRGTRIGARTDVRGRARLRVAAGTEPGRTRYRLSAAGRDLEGVTGFEVVTVPAAPVAVRLDPERIDAVMGEAELPVVRVAVEDRFANPVPGVGVEIAAGPGDRAALVGQAATDGAGEAAIALAAERFAEAAETTWEIRVAGEALAVLPVRITSPPEPAAAAAAEAVVDAAALGGRPDSMPTDESPSAVDALVARGLARLQSGAAAEAEAHFRDALRVAPRRTDAQKGLAAAALAQNRTDEAILWYEVAVRQSPRDADAWEGLGQAYAVAGRRDQAADALARAAALDPEREVLTAEIADLNRAPGFVEASAWGGDTFDNEASGGLRRAELLIRPSPYIQLRGGWDKSLSLRSPELVRGPDEWDAWFGGISIDWGHSRRFSTSVEAGQRDQGFDLKQNAYRLVQSVRLTREDNGAVLSLGGFLGRWFDRDDWLFSAGLDVPVGTGLTLATALSYGETVGTNFSETGRHADDDGRAYVALGYVLGNGMSLKPAVGIGRISSERDGVSGTLLDLLLESGIPVTGGSRVHLFVRHQRSPGSDPFTVIAAGLSLHLGWAGG